MQEQENIAMVDTVYAPIFAIVSEATELIVYGPSELPFTGEFRGPEGVQRFLEALKTTQEDITVEIVDRIAQGNKVVFTGTYSAKISATGRQLSVWFAHIWTVQNGKISKLLDFFDTAAVHAAYSL